MLFFDLTHNPVILVKTGISGVSAESAANNLKAELPGWDFEQVRRDAREKWNQQLSRISITTEQREAHRRIFYAALYHASLGPALFDDVDGSYRGMDKQNHKLEPGQRNYTTFSLWDTYRAAHPLYTLIERGARARLRQRPHPAWPSKAPPECPSGRCRAPRPAP